MRRPARAALSAFVFIAVLGGLLAFAATPAAATHLGTPVFPVTPKSGTIVVTWTFVGGELDRNHVNWRVKSPQGPWKGTDRPGMRDSIAIWDCDTDRFCSYRIPNLVNDTTYEVRVSSYRAHYQWANLQEATPSAALVSDDATLRELTAGVTSDLSSDSPLLRPYHDLELESGDADWEATVPGDTDYVRLMPTVSDPNATITVTMFGQPGRPTISYRLASGPPDSSLAPAGDNCQVTRAGCAVSRGDDPHALVPPRETTTHEAAIFRLDVLHNRFRITVTAEDGTTTADYWVTIFRKAPDEWKDTGCTQDTVCPQNRPNSPQTWGSAAAGADPPPQPDPEPQPAQPPADTPQADTDPPPQPDPEPQPAQPPADTPEADTDPPPPNRLTIAPGIDGPASEG